MAKHSLGDKPIQPEYQQLMVASMNAIDEVFNGPAKGKDRQVGIVLLVFPYGSTDGRCNYISNGADRKEIAIMLREQAARFEGQPEMKGHA